MCITSRLFELEAVVDEIVALCFISLFENKFCDCQSCAQIVSGGFTDIDIIWEFHAKI